MKVLFDHQIFTDQKYGGISRYFYELLQVFHSQKLVKASLSLKWSNNEYLQEGEIVKAQRFLENMEFKGKSRIMSALNRWYTLQNLRKGNFDVFHPTYYDPYFLPSLKGKPFVVTCYDLIQEKFPELHSEPKNNKLLLNKRLLLQSSSKIIAISESTKKDIMEVYGTKSSQIAVISLASSLGDRPIQTNVSLELPRQYFLFVGNRSLYKNFAPYITAVASLLRAKNDLTLVCAGGGTFSLSEKELFSQLGVTEKIKHLPVNNDVLTLLYRHAVAFVFPSLYEGFGIPVLEAFGCGCPVLLSDTSSLPEVAGEAALYFDPYNQESMLRATEMLLSDECLQKELILKGHRQRQKFSWEKTAALTTQVYQSLI